MLDENAFFRDVTLRLCGSLEIEEGLRACVEYLADQMPADSLYLQWYEEALGAMHFVARATAEQGEAMDLLVPLDQAARVAMAGMGSAPHDEVPSVLVVNLPQEEPVTRCLLEALALPPSSVMSVPLVVGAQLVGALVLIAGEGRRFTEEQARLYAALREPFFVAMSNTLEHREVLRLRDRLAEDNHHLQRELLRFSGKEVMGAGAAAAAKMEADQAEQALDLDTVMAQHISRVLELSGGKIHGPGGAGELLGINPNTLRYKMRKLGLKFRKDRVR